MIVGVNVLYIRVRSRVLQLSLWYRFYNAVHINVHEGSSADNACEVCTQILYEDSSGSNSDNGLLIDFFETV